VRMPAADMLIVIPVFDEAATIGEVARAARRHGPVLVVDDGSRDGSAAVAAAAGAEVIRHPRRLGKGQALRTGIAAARARGARLVATLDGDGQHDPDDLPALLAAARDQRALVIGNRLARPADAAAVVPARRHALRLAGLFVAWVGGRDVEDTQSGFRVYPMALLDRIRTRHGGFVLETEILLAATAAGWAVREVPVAARPRAAARSRFRPLLDGARLAAFLAARSVVRWATELRAAGAAGRALLDPARLHARHAAMLEGAAPYAALPPAWGWALTAVAARRAAARLRGWWTHPRPRRAATFARIATLAPLALALVLLQALLGRRAPDLAAPVVGHLQALAGAAGRRPAEPARAPVALALGADAMAPPASSS
jgi:hypothetical protein